MRGSIRPGGCTCGPIRSKTWALSASALFKRLPDPRAPEPLPQAQAPLLPDRPALPPAAVGDQCRAKQSKVALDASACKSVLRLPCRFLRLAGPSRSPILLSPNGIRKAEGAFYYLTVAAQEQFATSPLFFAGFQFGDEAQRAAVDLFFDGLDLRILRPEWIDHTIGSIARQAVATGRALLPGDNLRLYIDSLRNALTVVNLVNRSFSLLALPPGPIDLRNAIEKSYSFGEYEPLWLVEGLGEAYANQNWLDAAPVHGLLSTGQGAHLPEKSLLMMHAGMGISFAKHLIRPLTPVTPRRRSILPFGAS